MATDAIIGVVLDDGAILASRVRGSATLARVLATRYATRAAAADLVTLGDLAHVGETITDCIPADPPADAEALAGD